MLSHTVTLFSASFYFPHSKSFTVSRKDWSDGDIVLENDQLHITFDSSHGMMTVRFPCTLNKIIKDIINTFAFISETNNS